MNVNLTAEQLQAVKDGTMVHLSVPELEMECVVMRADLCRRIGAVIEDKSNVLRTINSAAKPWIISMIVCG